jgi:hypothetical protein
LAGDSERRRRSSITNLSPADLVPLLCKNCGLALEGGDEAAIFLCSSCGLAYEPSEEGLAAFSPLTAAATTELAVGAKVQFLAVWRLAVLISAAADSAWQRISKVTAPAPAYLFVPAFTLARPVVQRLGVGLTEAQPELELTPGFRDEAPHRPALVGVGDGGDGAPGAAVAAPDFGTFSPVVVGRKDAQILAHFVYIGMESHETRDLRSVDYELEPVSEELLFLPAVWDPRYIHESNWRLLLREFDGLVA